MQELVTASMDKGLRHDLGNLLTCVGVSAGALRQVLSEIERSGAVAPGLLQEARGLADQIEYAGRLAVQLVRVRAPRNEARASVEGCLSAVLGRVIAFAKPIAEERASLSLSLGAIPPVVGSEDELVRVFLNLILNALEAVEDRAPHGEVHVTARAVGDRVIAEVRDNGRGLPPGPPDRLFESGFTTSPRPGAGHGLTVTRNIVEGLGGALAMEPGAGSGVVVKVELPMRGG